MRAFRKYRARQTECQILPSQTISGPNRFEKRIYRRNVIGIAGLCFPVALRHCLRRNSSDDSRQCRQLLLDRELLLDPRTSLPAELISPCTIVEQTAHGIRQSVRIARLQNEAGHAVLHGFAYASEIGDDQRQAARLDFHSRSWK